jgi:hypothetical protein
MQHLFPFFLFATVVIVVAVYNFFFSDEAKVRRAIRSAHRVSIAEAKAGEIVRVAGKVKALGPLHAAPLSGRPCVYYEVSVEEYRSSGKSGKWVEIIHDTDGSDFLVVDATGKARVSTREMKALIVRDHKRESGTLNEAPPDLEAYLARHGRKSKGWIFNRNIRYREGVLAPGEEVVVLGEAAWEQDPDPTEAGTGYRNSPKRLVLRSRPDGLLLASDEPELL